ncbi:MAG TPA: helix-turn-helix transcriptional regulator [Coxiellaceae bacterium]|nr:MAG: XRE family transcriptional regulator [Gammaproteobacteria bacterium RIFCSPHIGHO2_12_FULL_36_30]HLB56429.1 helix-turn-helix transcriptional regulator [Coxiellaceae bacterium]
MKKRAKNKIKITKSSGNVFADLDIKDAEKYIAKAELARKINSIIEKRRLLQSEAATLLEIDQPKISALSCGRLDDFSLERLITFLNKLDRDVEIFVREPHNKRVHKTGHLTVAFG